MVKSLNLKSPLKDNYPIGKIRSPKPLRKEKTISWNEDRDLSLLTICYTNGIHKKHQEGGKKEVPKTYQKLKWNAVLDEFFAQDEHIHFEKPKGSRKLRDHYNEIIKKVSHKHGWGEYGGTTQNLSRYDGDLAEVDKIVKKILEEQDCNEDDYSDDEKLDVKNGQKLSAEMEKTEDIVWDPRQKKPLKKKKITGEVVNLTDVSKKPRLETFEDKLLNIVVGSQLKNVDEEDVEVKMLAYMSKEQIDVTKFLLIGEIDDTDADTFTKLKKVGLATIVNMYCTPGNKFAALQFKTDLKNDIRINGLHVHQIYALLQKLKSLALIPLPVIVSASTPLPVSVVSSVVSATFSSSSCQSSVSDNTPLVQGGEVFMGIINQEASV